MRMQRMFGLAAALLMADAALATVPFTNDVFGKVESTLDYCAQVDSGSAAKYKEKKRALVKDVPENEVTDARNPTGLHGNVGDCIYLLRRVKHSSSSDEQIEVGVVAGGCWHSWPPQERLGIGD